jgi:hypothetical protein
VSWGCVCCRACSRLRSQVAALCIGAVTSGTMLCLWQRMDKEGQASLWRLYGWFSALMCAGSVFGALAWGFWMRALTAEFAATGDELNTTARSRPDLSLEAQSQYARSTFYVLYAVSFLCLSVSKLLVHRPPSFITVLQLCCLHTNTLPHSLLFCGM